jgi:hypothetical protein
MIHASISGLFHYQKQNQGGKKNFVIHQHYLTEKLQYNSN